MLFAKVQKQLSNFSELLCTLFALHQPAIAARLDVLFTNAILEEFLCQSLTFARLTCELPPAIRNKYPQALVGSRSSGWITSRGSGTELSSETIIWLEELVPDLTSSLSVVRSLTFGSFTGGDL